MNNAYNYICGSLSIFEAIRYKFIQFNILFADLKKSNLRIIGRCPLMYFYYKKINEIPNIIFLYIIIAAYFRNVIYLELESLELLDSSTFLI